MPLPGRRGHRGGLRRLWGEVAFYSRGVHSAAAIRICVLKIQTKGAKIIGSNNN